MEVMPATVPSIIIFELSARLVPAGIVKLVIAFPALSVTGLPD